MAKHSVPAVDANLAASSNEEVGLGLHLLPPQRDFIFEVLSERQDIQFARLADKIDTSLSRVSDALWHVLQNSNKRDASMTGMREIIS